MNDQSPSMDEFKRTQVIEACKLLAVALLDFTDEGKADSLVPLHLMRTLPEKTRECLAEIALEALPADVAEDVCKVVFQKAGWPKPAILGDARDDARHWAWQATKPELRAYAMAIVERMSDADRKKFGDWVIGGEKPKMTGAPGGKPTYGGAS